MNKFSLPDHTGYDTYVTLSFDKLLILLYLLLYINIICHQVFCHSIIDAFIKLPLTRSGKQNNKRMPCCYNCSTFVPFNAEKVSYVVQESDIYLYSKENVDSLDISISKTNELRVQL